MQAGLHHSLPEAVSTAYRLNGISGFYVGYGATLMREVIPHSVTPEAPLLSTL
jgi:hypothetical protein